MKPPWGYFSTFGWALLAMIGGEIIATAIIWAWLGELPEPTPGSRFNVVAVSFEVIVVNVFVCLVVALVARFKGWSAREYLALALPGPRTLMFGIGVALALVAVLDVGSWLLGRDIVTPFQVETYKSAADKGAVWFAVLFVAVVIAAPVGEDILHRGFLFRGWAPTERAAPIAIVVISTLWALLHFQYDWYGIFQIFLIGLVLGALRWKSGSTSLTILCHALLNFIGVVETVIRMEYLGG